MEFPERKTDWCMLIIPHANQRSVQRWPQYLTVSSVAVLSTRTRMPHVFVCRHQFWSLNSKRPSKGVSRDGEPNARLPVTTCLGALPSPWLMRAICDIRMQMMWRRKARRKHAAVTIASWCSCVLVDWSQNTSHITHTSCWGGSITAQHGGEWALIWPCTESRVLLRDSSLWVSKCHEAASHTGIAVFVKKLAANSYVVCSELLKR